MKFFIQQRQFQVGIVSALFFTYLFQVVFHLPGKNEVLFFMLICFGLFNFLLENNEEKIKENYLFYVLFGMIYFLSVIYRISKWPGGSIMENISLAGLFGSSIYWVLKTKFKVMISALILVFAIVFSYKVLFLKQKSIVINEFVIYLCFSILTYGLNKMIYNKI